MNPVEHGKQLQAPSSFGDRVKHSPAVNIVVGFLVAMIGSAIAVGALVSGRAHLRSGGGVSAAEHPILYSLIVAFWLAWAGVGVWLMRKAARRIAAAKAAEFPEDH
jgi:hypothetical protein